MDTPKDDLSGNIHFYEDHNNIIVPDNSRENPDATDGNIPPENHLLGKRSGVGWGSKGRGRGVDRDTHTSRS